MASTINALTTGAGGIVATGDTSGALALQTNNGTTAMTIDTSQNVGIGTTSPTNKLTVSSGSGTIAKFTDGTTPSQIYSGGGYFGFFDGAGNNGIGGFTASNYVYLQTNATERMRVTANGGVSFGSSGTAYGTSGQVLQSNGDAAPTWVAAGMTLLGTITPTAVNSISLGSLSLTNYKALFVAFSNLGSSGTKQAIYVSSTNVQSGSGFSMNTTGSYYGTFWLELTTGSMGGNVYTATIGQGATINVAGCGGLSNISTSTTTIYFRQDSTNNFTATGSILIYGVK